MIHFCEIGNEFKVIYTNSNNLSISILLLVDYHKEIEIDIHFSFINYFVIFEMGWEVLTILKRRPTTMSVCRWAIASYMVTVLYWPVRVYI